MYEIYKSAAIVPEMFHIIILAVTWLTNACSYICALVVGKVTC